MNSQDESMKRQHLTEPNDSPSVNDNILDINNGRTENLLQILIDIEFVNEATVACGGRRDN